MGVVQLDYPRISEPKDPALDSSYLAQSLGRHKFQGTDLIRTAGQNVNFDGATVMDLACGIGTSTLQIARQLLKARVIGIDINPNAIRLAETLNSTNKPANLEFKVGDCYTLSGSALYITCFDSLHHFDHLNDLLQRIANALEPEGIFYFADLNRSYLSQVTTHTDGFIKRCYERREKGFEQLLTFLLDDPTPSNGRAITPEALTIISLMASYTPEEVAEILSRLGLDLLEIKTAEKRYEGVAVKRH